MLFDATRSGSAALLCAGRRWKESSIVQSGLCEIREREIEADHHRVRLVVPATQESTVITHISRFNKKLDEHPEVKKVTFERSLWFNRRKATTHSFRKTKHRRTSLR